VPSREPDLLHTCSIRMLDGTLAARSPAFRRGNLLLSLRHLDLVAILDPDIGKIVWALTGQWHVPRSAKLLASGRLLLLDNLGTVGAAARVLEVDPFTQQIAWSWGGRPDGQLFSETTGRVERLENGNSLICESKYGRAVEVTPEGQIVWEFVNPNRAGDKNELIAVLCSVERVPKDLPFLAGAEAR
jgi:arylsulfotransferase ASST